MSYKFEKGYHGGNQRENTFQSKTDYNKETSNRNGDRDLTSVKQS